MKVENRIKVSINSQSIGNNATDVKNHIHRELIEAKILATNYKCEVVVKYGDRKVTINRFSNVDLVVESWFNFK